MSELVVDALVVGLGPAGSNAAERIAASGFSVLGIDKKQKIGSPVQCAEFIPGPLIQMTPDSTSPIQRIKKMRTSLPSGKSALVQSQGFMIDRQEFDLGIAQLARNSGASLSVDTSLLKLNIESRTATLRQGQHEIDVVFQFLVAADGPHSKTARLLGLVELQTMHTRQYTVPLYESRDDIEVWLSNELVGGYAWLFPKGETANLGLGVDKGIVDDLKAPLDKLHAQLCQQGIVGDQIFKRTGGSIPVEGLRSKIAYQCCLFAGDAAGLTHPITGAGIASAVQSGQMAGDAIVAALKGEKYALSEYEEDIDDLFGRVVERAVQRREDIMRVWHGGADVDDKLFRKTWIAFDEYYESTVEV